MGGTKILPGSIVQQATDLQSGATVDHIIDRDGLLISQNAISWDGLNLSFTENIELHIPTQSGGLAINVIPFSASAITLNNDQCFVVYINRANGTNVLTAGTYGSLTAGQYAIVNLASLSAITILTKDHYLLFRRKDTTDGVHNLLIPFNKQVLSPGDVAYLGSHPPADIYTATLMDPVDTVLPSGASAVIDGVTVTNGMTVLFTGLSSGNNEVYVVSGVGTSLVWTPVLLFEGVVAPPNSTIIKILQGISYADRLGIFTGTYWNFDDIDRKFNQIGDYWEQSSLRNLQIVANSSGTIFSVAAAGSENWVLNFSIVRSTAKETGQIFITHNGSTCSIDSTSADLSSVGVSFSAIISAGNLIVSYTADNAGPNGSMKWWYQRWSDTPGGPASIPTYGNYNTLAIGYLNAAYVMSDGSNIADNCSEPYLVAGKTRVDLGFAYTPSINPGTTAGDVDVIADGHTLPRYVPGVTVDAYYKEISPGAGPYLSTIEFWGDLTTPSISLEFRRKQGTIDVNSSTALKINAMYDAVVGSPTQVLNGIAQFSSIQTAINFSPVGSRILILQGTYVENVSLNKAMFLEGKGYSTILNGTLNLISGADHSLLKFMYITGNISFGVTTTGCILTDSWQNSGSTVSDLGIGNIFTLGDG